MTIAGIHLEPVPEGSEDFTTYQQLMNSKLIKLFKLEYSEVDPRGLSGPEWSPVHFFHGTGHCGCASYHAVETSGNLIATASWCSTDWCAVRGILHSGHLLRFSKGTNAYHSRLLPANISKRRFFNTRRHRGPLLFSALSNRIGLCRMSQPAT